MLNWDLVHICSEKEGVSLIMAIYSFYSWLLPTLADERKSIHEVTKPMRQTPLPLITGG
jgi:hypothetical protein